MPMLPAGTVHGVRGLELTSEFIALTSWATRATPCSSSSTPTWTAPRLPRRRGRTTSRRNPSALTLLGAPQRFFLPLSLLLRLLGVRVLRRILYSLDMLLTIFLACFFPPTSFSPRRRLTAPFSTSPFTFTADSGYCVPLEPFLLTGFFRLRLRAFRRPLPSQQLAAASTWGISL